MDTRVDDDVSAAASAKGVEDTLGDRHRPTDSGDADRPVDEGDTDEPLISVQELYAMIHGGPSRAPYMRDERNFLIIDCRPCEDFGISHFVSAFNINLEAFSQDFLSHRSDFKRFWNGHLPASVYASIIVYDASSETLADTGPKTRFFFQSLIESAELHQNILLVQGGYGRIHKLHPDLLRSQRMCPKERAEWQPYASEIVEKQIYLGDYRQSEWEDMLKRLRITHILNVSQEHANMFPSLCKYVKFPIKDDESEDIDAIFDASYKFIADCLAIKGTVFVHCTQGISRSPTLVIAYLMRANQWNLVQAAEIVSKFRPMIRPNGGFIKHLLKMEMKLLGTQSDPHVAFSHY